MSANYPLNVAVERNPLGRYNVTVTTTGLDRSDVHAIHGIKTQDLADRLADAINAGKALQVQGVLVDANGKSYLNTRARVMGRYLNADLKRLGF